MTFLSKQDLTVAGSQPTNRNTSGAATSMRKYQQLALAIISIISLSAFLFYKHEYDRLRYTLEYLETFGSLPKVEDDLPNSCGDVRYNKVFTAPAQWTKITSELAVYSIFWDEGNGLPKPVLRSLAIIKQSNKPQTELRPILFYEKSVLNSTSTCSFKNAMIVSQSEGKNGIIIKEIICQVDSSIKQIPILVQLKSESLSPMIYVQQSENWNSVPNISAICVFSPNYPISTIQLIEFVSFHHIIGFDKFVFYGPILTQVARNLVHKYSDAAGIFFEEKEFQLPHDFTVDEEVLRKIVELDCLYRHRNKYENIITLQMNQFLMPKVKTSLPVLLNDMFVNKGQMSSTITEFHLTNQQVCIDQKHGAEKNELLLSAQLFILKPLIKKHTRILRPHLATSSSKYTQVTVKNEQHVPYSVASIISIDYCLPDFNHQETDHLPANKRFVEQVKGSLLYHYWARI